MRVVQEERRTCTLCEKFEQLADTTGESLQGFVEDGRFIEFVVQHNLAGMKAIPPMRLLPVQFEGRMTLEKKLEDRARKHKKDWEKEQKAYKEYSKVKAKGNGKGKPKAKANGMKK